MLKNATLDAKIGFDPAENEPPKVLGRAKLVEPRAFEIRPVGDAAEDPDEGVPTFLSCAVTGTKRRMSVYW